MSDQNPQLGPVTAVVTLGNWGTLCHTRVTGDLAVMISAG